MVSPSLWKFLKESNNFSRKYPFYVKWQQWWHIKKGASSSVVTFRAILFSEKTWDGQLDGSCQMFQNLTPFPLLLKYYRHLYIKPHILLRCDIRVLKMVDQLETLSTRWDKNDYKMTTPRRAAPLAKCNWSVSHNFLSKWVYMHSIATHTPWLFGRPMVTVLKM